MPLYPSYKEQILGAGINLTSSDIRWMLVKSTYTYDSTDVFVTDMTPASNDNGRMAAGLGTKTVTGGVFDAADDSLVATSAVACNALILFQHTGSDATARLIAYVSVSAFTPSASQTVDIVHDNGANKIFAL